jgi:hypothetical protein
MFADVTTTRLQWAEFVDRQYGARRCWMDHVVLAMVPRAYPNTRLIVHKRYLPPVDDTPSRPQIVRLWNTNGHFMSLRDRE